jgi:hypothetical protein
MSSTGHHTSGHVPESAYLGTPRGQPDDGRRSRSPPKDPPKNKPIKDAPASPDWVAPNVASHRGSGSVPKNQQEIQDQFPGGGNSAELARPTRSASARSARSSGPSGPSRKVITPRSPRTVPRTKAAPIQDSKTLKDIKQISELRNMIVQANHTYAKILEDGQFAFAEMQKEYHDLLRHCRDLAATISNQGQEIYGDGRRIDELDNYILRGNARIVALDAQSQGMKVEYESLLKVESAKLLDARKEVEGKDALLQQSTARLQTLYETACGEVQALVRDRKIDRARIEECESSLVKARADAASARTETWSILNKERFGISQIQDLKDEHARTIHAGNLSLTEVQTKFELSQQEVARIRLIGENLERQHQLQVSEVARLNEKVADRAPGYQKLKLSMESIIHEQKLALEKQVRTSGVETQRLNDQIYELEDLCNQHAQTVAVRAGSEDAYLESVRASAGLITTLATRPSRRSGGDPAGGSGGNPGGSGSGNGNGGAQVGPNVNVPASATARVLPQQSQPGGGGPPDDDDFDDCDDDDWDEDEEEEEEDHEEDHPVEAEAVPDPAPAPKRRAKAKAKVAAAAVPTGAVKHTLKSREQDKVIVPRFPTLVQLEQYAVALANNLIFASSLKDCAEIGWLGETRTKTFDELGDSGMKRFESLDVKLSMALAATIRDSKEASQLYQELLEHQRVHLRQQTITKGRQIYWLILNFHKVNDSQEVVIGIEHLTLLAWKGDHKMAEFKHHWDSIMRRMTDPLTESTLRGLLYKKLLVSKVLREDISHFDRMENDNEHKNISYLWNAINRAIRIRKERKNADEQENYLRNELSASGVPATPAKASAETKAKAKAKATKAAKAAKEAGPATPAPPAPSDWTLVGGRSRSKGPKTDADVAKVCWFHNREGCTKNGCQFNHTTLSEADKKRQIAPARSGSPGPSKGAGKGKGKGKPKGKGKSKGARSRTASPATSGRGRSPGPTAPDQRWCRAFLAGSCTWSPCKFKHLTQEQVDKIVKLQEAAK